MSVEIIKNLSNIESVDVNEDVQENETKSEISSDSGVETLESHNINCQSLSESEISPTKYINSAINLEEKPLYQDALQTQSIDDIFTDIFLKSDDKSINDVNCNDTFNENLCKEIKLRYDCNKALEEIEIEKTHTDCNTVNNNIPDTILYSIEDIHKPLSDNNLTTSTISLDEQVVIENSNFKFKTNSRSAENISLIDNNIKNTKLTPEVEKEQILSQFKNQKQKVSATQKILSETPQNVDTRYGRIPKEILSQDIGSIVKNVHGIFSSVGGSLINAYNYSHKTSNSRAQIRNIKTPNGKVMNDIFEDVQNVPNDKNVDNCLENNISQPSNVNENISLNLEPLSTIPKDNSTDMDDNNGDLHKLQVESLERVLSEQRRENGSLREKVKQQMDELHAKDQTFKELEIKVDLMCRRAEQAQKEKDAAVMRYASTECAAIEAKKAAEAALKAERAANAEKDLLTAKIRNAREEKQRICQLYDDKCHEVLNAERDAYKVREELREVEGRLKWTQNKLRMEADAYKEFSERAEKLSQQVTELEAAKDTAAANAADSVRAKQLDTELKENQAALILCRHEKEDLERRLTATLLQLDCCKRERDEAVESLAHANAQVDELKESNLRLEEEAAELAALRARAALADTLASQLTRESERARRAEDALGEERARAETCARREAAALEHAATLTAQHVASRASAHDYHAKAQALSVDNASLRERVAALEAEKIRLRAALVEETDRRNKENRVLARKVAELTEEVQEANKKLEWEQGENNVLKKKHTSAIKEMNRELQRALKRIEQLEAKLPQPTDADSTRTGSVSSLSSSEGASSGDRAGDVPPVEQAREPDKQALIERIVALQRAAARRSERCDFLEEHARALTAELRGKAKLLRRLLPALPPAQLAPSAADGAKQEIARLGGGAMAAVWGGDPEGMTFELSLEINRRLQALLEDTLLKNITLKENIDTLGEEIARLKTQKSVPSAK